MSRPTGLREITIPSVLGVSDPRGVIQVRGIPRGGRPVYLCPGCWRKMTLVDGAPCAECASETVTVVENVGDGMLLSGAGANIILARFQSNHAHHISTGYISRSAMPIPVVPTVAGGGRVVIHDGRTRPGLTDALRIGVPTWCLVYNRALGKRDIRVCDWETPEMRAVAHSSKHSALTRELRRVVKCIAMVSPFYTPQPAVIGDNVFLVVHEVDSLENMDWEAVESYGKPEEVVVDL